MEKNDIFDLVHMNYFILLPLFTGNKVGDVINPLNSGTLVEFSYIPGSMRFQNHMEIFK